MENGSEHPMLKRIMNCFREWPEGTSRYKSQTLRLLEERLQLNKYVYIKVGLKP